MPRISTCLAPESALGLCALHTLAQPTPVGRWGTLDASSGKAKPLVRIVDTGGAMSGTLEKQLDPAAPPGALCDKCLIARGEICPQAVIEARIAVITAFHMAWPSRGRPTEASRGSRRWRCAIPWSRERAFH
jgi:hypothetical protein